MNCTIWRSTSTSAPFSASSVNAIVALVIVVSFRQGLVGRTSTLSGLHDGHPHHQGRPARGELLRATPFAAHRFKDLHHARGHYRRMTAISLSRSFIRRVRATASADDLSPSTRGIGPTLSRRVGRSRVRRRWRPWIRPTGGFDQPTQLRTGEGRDQWRRRRSRWRAPDCGGQGHRGNDLPSGSHAPSRCFERRRRNAVPTGLARHAKWEKPSARCGHVALRCSLDHMKDALTPMAAASSIAPYPMTCRSPFGMKQNVVVIGQPGNVV